MDVRRILATKRDGQALSKADIDAFITGYVAGDVRDYEASALLMAIFMVGMEEDELFHWTGAMLRSGDVMDLEGIAGPKADKHSTGGVGDKVSIPLAPAVAACGVRVPMVSGRGLGHTGGTLDKLESIPGFRTALDPATFRRVLERTGVAFGGQTERLVPADKKLYALRDVTGLVASIPLMASSILSKKLAEGLDALVLDVKFGSGAFLADPERGAELARTMLGLTERFGLPATVFQTSMGQPLGLAVGHTLEIAESLACLAGDGPADLRELVTTFGGELLVACGAAEDLDAGRGAVAASLDDGRAMDVFERVVAEQGGDTACIADPGALPSAPDVETIVAEEEGVLLFADCCAVGEAVAALGGGRQRLEDEIDPVVGVVFHKRAGERVRAGDALVEIHHRDGAGLPKCRRHLARALWIDEIGEAWERPPLVLSRLTA